MTGNSTVTLKIADARALAQQAVERLGYQAADARVVADHVIDAELCGYGYGGLAKILNAAENPRNRKPRRPVAVVKETRATALVDGGNNIGMLSVFRATEIAIDKAKAHGIAMVGVYDSFNSGRSAYYVEKIARARLVGLHLVSASPQVAVPGGARPVLGTNPIAFGIPRDGDPLIFDMGTSAMMGSDLMLKSRLNEALPEGMAVDSDGNPTRDPHEARKGSLLTFGGYKGFGLSLCIQALGLLAGGASVMEKYYGFLLIAIDPALFLPAGQFEREVDGLLAQVRATGRGGDETAIRIPSERAFRERALRVRQDAIEIERKVFDALNAL
jgi:LDH2 family malate/lactate/ureidoglycolate dehydrogenase